MASQSQGFPTTSRSTGRVRCWIECLLLVLVIPAATWAVGKLISVSIPSADHGSPAQRYLYWVSHGVVVEWLVVVALWFLLRSRGSSFKEFGVWRVGTWAAWAVALLFAALSIANNLRFFRFAHIPISYAFFPSGFHLVAALVMGITAGFCEEIMFRGFLMTELAKAGYSKFVQVFIQGIAFGLAHAGYLSQGFIAWLGIAVPTAFLGMMWGIAYLLGRRSLIPVIVAHFFNDSIALPWILFFMATASS